MSRLQLQCAFKPLSSTGLKSESIGLIQTSDWVHISTCLLKNSLKDVVCALRLWFSPRAVSASLPPSAHEETEARNCYGSIGPTHARKGVNRCLKLKCWCLTRADIRNSTIRIQFYSQMNLNWCPLYWDNCFSDVFNFRLDPFYLNCQFHIQSIKIFIFGQDMTHRSFFTYRIIVQIKIVRAFQ